VKTTTEIANYYASRLAETGTGWGAADCGSWESHENRLMALSFVSLGRGPGTVLDVGCGVGDLLGRQMPGRYTGWDISGALIGAARGNWPGADFHVRDLYASTEERAFDYVVASGLFQFADPLRLRVGVERMWALCRKAVAFNFLTRADDTPGEHWHDPLAVLAFCRTLTPRVVLRMDYLPNDATVYLYRD
jgi:SAM-dependent methyltransferase